MGFCMRIILKSKIHRATVTDVNLDYEGSIGVDGDLMRAADLLPYEQVHVLDLNNGARFETYAMEEPAASGRIAIYGAAARLVAQGDSLIILSYEVLPDEAAQQVRPRIVYVDENNRALPALEALSS